MIRWIVMDMDGTLLTEEKKISSYTKEMLIKAQEKGYRLILASGRPTRGMENYAKDIHMDQYHGLLLSYNGSYVVDLSDQHVYFHKPLSIELSKQILKHIQSFDVYAMIDRDEYMFVNDVYAPHVRHESKNVGHNFLCEVQDLAQFCHFPLNKIIVCGDKDYLKQHYQQIAKPFIGQVNSMFTGEVYYEFNAFNVNKQKALEATLHQFNSGMDQVIAFGDGYNDREMIEHACIGIAMENACDELKEIADDITSSNEEDGIGKALVKYLDL